MRFVIFAAILISYERVSSLTNASTCPTLYSYFNGTCYKVVQNAIEGNWGRTCDLVTGGKYSYNVEIASAEVNQFLLRLTAPFTNQTDFWIGLFCPNAYRAGEKQTCRYNDIRKPVTYTNFDSYSPLNGYPYTTFTRKTGKWNSNTGQGKYYSLCQIDPTKSGK